jgi:O-antigen/teichoic acid export membrane protein
LATSVLTPGVRRRAIPNAVWNIAGQLVPLVVGVLTLPALIRLVGLDRFGFISLVWVLVGYASVFDFGIGRALIRTVAAHLGRGSDAGARASAQAGLFFLGLFGLVIGSALALAGPWLIGSVMKVPPDLQGEARVAMVLLGASLPLVMLTTGYVGTLSAHQHFRELNLIRMVMGVASYAGPLLVALWVNRLEAIVGFVLVMRLLATLAHAWVCSLRCGFRLQPALPQREHSRELFTLGGWMAVSNLVSPMLSYLDRLLLSALVPVRAVAFYATPFDLISKAMILPNSIMAAVFPRASAVEAGSEAARRMLGDNMRRLFVLMFPLLFAFVALARPGLSGWLGAEFAQHSAPVLQILAIGLLFNALAQGPAMLIQAAGEPRWMAKTHLVELPLFVGLLWLLTSHYGIVGTAAASALRNSIDAVIVFMLARRGVAQGLQIDRSVILPAALAAALFAAALWVRTWAESLIVLLPGLALFCAFAWWRVLQPGERNRLLELAQGRRSF